MTSMGDSQAKQDRVALVEDGAGRGILLKQHEAAGQGQGQKAIAKLHVALLPLCVLVVVCCYLDRTALAFAALQLCEEAWLTPQAYGLGSGMFFIGYVIFQIPSNMMLTRVGPARWLAIIIFAWGVIAACFSLIRSQAAFFTLRFLLGVAEAGAFPGLWYILSLMYPSAYSTFPFSVIEASIALSQIIAAPLAAALLQLHNVGGLVGWQWLFIVEGCATILLSIVLLYCMPSSITSATFLSEEEKSWLVSQMQSTPGGGDGSPQAAGWKSFVQVVQSWKVWHLGIIKLLKDIAFDGLLFWLPTLVAFMLSAQAGHANGLKLPSHTICQKHTSTVQAVLWTSLPFACAALCTLVLGHSSERTGAHRLHAGIPLLIGGLAFALLPLVIDTYISLGFVAIIFAMIGSDASTAPIWSLLRTVCGADTLPVAFPFVNSVGKVGGFLGPFIFGALVQHTNSYFSSLLVVAACLVAGGAMALLFPRSVVQNESYMKLTDTEMAVSSQTE